MKYKDAGKKLDTVGIVAPAGKYYPRVTLDEKGDFCMDDVVPLRGRVCGIHKTEYGNSVEVEITEVGIPDVGSKAKEPRNEADRDLDKMMKR